MKSFRTILSAGFLASALVLAGCGGGSESNGMDGAQMDADKAAEELAARQADQRMAIENAHMMALTAVGAVENDSDQAVVDAANAAVMALRDAIGNAADLAEDDEVLVSASGSLDSIESLLMASLNARKMAMDAADKAAQDAADMAADMAAMKMRDDARKVFNAIVRDREFDNTGGKATHLRLTRNLKGTAAGLNVDPLNLSLRHGIDPDAGDQSSTTSTANDRGDSATNNNTYQPKEDVGIPVTEMLPALAGWKGNKYVSEHPDDPLTCAFPEGCMKGITDSLVIYHNQAPAKDAESQTFAERYGVDANDDGNPDNAWYREAVAGGAPAGILDAGLEANKSLIMSDGFSTAGTDMHTTEDDDVFMVMGTFDGVSGTYSCTHDSTDGACTSSYGDDGVITLDGGGGWTFVPNDPNAMVTLGDPAAASMFVTYGYWMRELSGDDGWTDVRPLSEIRQNSVPHANGVAQAIKGSATYTGGAAGMYAIYHPVADGSSSGEWTANAMLTADFNEQMVSGELTGFMAEGKAMDWKVELLEGGINSATTAPDPASRAREAAGNGGFKLDGSNHGFANAENGTVWTMGGMDGEKTGSWYGDFWAPKGDTVDTTDHANNPAPAAATGVFWSEYGDTGRMTGAFGVERDEN